MDKKSLGKVAKVAAAGLLPATGLVLATQPNADAAVTYSCGKNLNPSSASNTMTLEHKKGRVPTGIIRTYRCAKESSTTTSRSSGPGSPIIWKGVSTSGDIKARI